MTREQTSRVLRRFWSNASHCLPLTVVCGSLAVLMRGCRPEVQLVASCDWMDRREPVTADNRSDERKKKSQFLIQTAWLCQKGQQIPTRGVKQSHRRQVEHKKFLTFYFLQHFDGNLTIQMNNIPAWIQPASQQQCNNSKLFPAHFGTFRAKVKAKVAILYWWNLRNKWKMEDKSCCRKSNGENMPKFVTCKVHE